MQQLSIPLSRLHPSKRNPRRVKPAREAHHRLVALIRAQGLIQPLVVRPYEGKPKHFWVVAGNRRLAALQDLHRNDGEPKVDCVLRRVDANAADALSLGENFGQEPMHPLDEAEAFANLASQDGKDVAAIAAEFGVKEHYVRQRMKLATLATPIKAAYRANVVDTATAEAFTAVPTDRQLEVWKELDGKPHHAQHVHNIIANDWIDADQAIFDRSLLPESAVSQDLFGEKVLVERKAFLEAQSSALAAEQRALLDDGWLEAVVGKREDFHDRLLSMDVLQKRFDAATTKKLAKIASDQKKLDTISAKVDENDERRLQRLQRRFDSLEEKRRQIEDAAPVPFSEESKARATAFLILDPDGRVYREYRIPKRERPRISEGSSIHRDGNEIGASQAHTPTSDDLSDRQLAVTFTHQVLCVREALLKNTSAGKRVLALLLHEKVRSEALAMRHDANGTTLHASIGEKFTSGALDRVQAIRAKIDPFRKPQVVDDTKAYVALSRLSAKKLDELVEVLVVELVTAHLQRPTSLVALLAEELGIDIRQDWKPDKSWLEGYQKIQLAHLVVDLKGKLSAPGPERKKSELVSEIAKLFDDAANGTLEDKTLAKKLNDWLPANLRKLKKNR